MMERLDLGHNVPRICEHFSVVGYSCTYWTLKANIRLLGGDIVLRYRPTLEHGQPDHVHLEMYC